MTYNQTYDLTFDEDSSAPSEPVTLEEAKLFCKIDVDEDDALIEDVLIPAARQMCEDYSNIGFVRRTITATFNNGNGGYYLPLGPVYGTPTGVNEYGTALTTLNIPEGTWRQVLEPRLERMSVTYEAGYETLPQKLRTALLNQIMFLYDNRSQGVDGAMSHEAQLILNPLRRIW